MTTTDTHNENDLYVGYLPTPRRHRRALRLVVPATLWALCAISALVAASMNRTGEGTWDTTDTKAYVGTIIARPYPAIITEPEGDPADDTRTRSTLFLLEPGKVGPRDGLEQLSMQGARVEGFILERDNRQIVELLPGDQGVAPINDGRIDFVISDPLGPATLRGEIVDYKCYLGAMKPGHGRAHRACATLCISSGIPPALIVRDQSGNPTYYILRTPDGQRLNEQVLPFVAAPVEIQGEVVRELDVLYLETTADHITRL